MVNQNPGQIVRDKIDKMLKASGWAVQSNKKINFNEGRGQAIREYPTDVGSVDYVRFVDKKEEVGVIEAKREELGHKITDVERLTEGMLERLSISVQYFPVSASALPIKNL